MKKCIALLLVSYCIVTMTSGQFNLQNMTGSDLYVKGTEQIRIGDFKGGDSLLTMALCTYKDENVYFNRAISRLYLTDTSGACADLDIGAKKYFDKEAARIFHQYCCEYVDTLYYDEKFNSSDRSDFRFYEVLLKTKYTGETSGTFHDKKANKDAFSIDFGCNEGIVTLLTKKTDMIGSYILVDSAKYFNVASKSAYCARLNEYNDLKNRAQIAFKAKYNDLKLENKLETLNAYFQIQVTKAGDISGIKYLGTHPKIELGKYEDNFKKDLISLVNDYPKLSPAKFRGEAVNFISYDFISF